MPEKFADKPLAEEVSASLSNYLGKLDDALAKAASGNSSPEQSGKSKSSVTPPSVDNMEEALGSALNKTLGKADGTFLAGLLESGEADDPSRRDYGDRYQYQGVIGEGGQGKVLRFRDTVLDREVAIKVVKAPFTSERETLLENEARLGGMLEHPNILPTYDLCRDETGSPFFVMKKVEGVSFDELLKKAHAEGTAKSSRDRGEYSRRRLLNIFLQICHAMQYAHSRGVFHLDLKPQNVKLGPFGEVYVLDWGFASRNTDNPKMVAGTPLYIAPERFRQGKPDERCDIYSLGVMLYRILVNQLPRDVGKTTFKEFRRRIKDFPIIPPRQRDHTLPRDLEAIIMKALAEDPAGRYQTVEDLADDLERYLDILPVTAYREGVGGRMVKFARRHRAPVMAGAVMAAALALTAGAYIRGKSLAAQTEQANERMRIEQERRQLAIDQLRLAEDERRKAQEEQRRADAARKRAQDEQKKAEQARLKADDARRELLRRRAAARVPLEKGLDIMDKSKSALDKERDKAKKLKLIEPAIAMFTQALGILETGAQENLDAAGAYYSRGRAYEQAQEFSKAMEDYRLAYQRDPSYILAHYYRGLLAFNLNRDRGEQMAMEEFTSMNAIEPGNEFSEAGQAYIDAHRGREAEALARVDNIEKRERERAAKGAAGDAAESWRNPGLSIVWLVRGLVYGRKEGDFYDPKKGIEAYSNYLFYDPDKPSPYTNRGVLHEALYLDTRLGDKEAAEKELNAALADYTRALDVDPRYKLALQHRGYALFQYKKDIDGALKDIERALEIDPKYTAAILDRAAIRESQGNYDLALQDYELVKECDPKNRNVDYRLGIFYLYANDLDKADRAFTRAIDQAPNANARGIRFHRRGIVRFLRGDYQGAVDDFDKSLEIRKSGQIYPALMRWLALAKLGKHPPPDEFGRYVDVAPGQPWLAVVASIYLGEEPISQNQVLRIASTPEGRCETGFYLGALNWVQGDSEDALYFLDQAVESDVKLFMEYSMAKILAKRIRAQAQNAMMLPDVVGLPPTVPSLGDLVGTDGK